MAAADAVVEAEARVVVRRLRLEFVDEHVTVGPGLSEQLRALRALLDEDRRANRAALGCREGWELPAGDGGPLAPGCWEAVRGFLVPAGRDEQKPKVQQPENRKLVEQTLHEQKLREEQALMEQQSVGESPAVAAAKVGGALGGPLGAAPVAE